MKYFRMSYDEILNRRSYKNIILLNASIPSYSAKSDTKTTEEAAETRRMPQHANEIFDQLL